MKSKSKANDSAAIAPVEAQQLTPNGAQPADQQRIEGRCIFIVSTTAAGISVQTALMSNEGQLIAMPAVFPDVAYALDQIDRLRQAVLQHFGQAAQVGAQVIAQSLEQQATRPSEARPDASQEKP